MSEEAKRGWRKYLSSRMVDAVCATINATVMRDLVEAELATLRTRAKAAEARVAELEAERKPAPTLSPRSLAWARAEAKKLEAREEAMRGVMEAAREWAKPCPSNDQLQKRESKLLQAVHALDQGEG